MVAHGTQSIQSRRYRLFFEHFAILVKLLVEALVFHKNRMKFGYNRFIAVLTMRPSYYMSGVGIRS
jgi:hypothetical protein